MENAVENAAPSVATEIDMRSGFIEALHRAWPVAVLAALAAALAVNVPLKLGLLLAMVAGVLAGLLAERRTNTLVKQERSRSEATNAVKEQEV